MRAPGLVSSSSADWRKTTPATAYQHQYHSTVGIPTVKGTTMKVLFIPWNDREPVEVRELDPTAPGYFQDLKDLVFGDAEVETKLIEIYSVPAYQLAFAFDEEGMYNQSDEVNSRAQKLMAHTLGARPDQLVDLHGNYVAYGYSFSEDDEVVFEDVPGIALNYFAEEGIGSD